MKREESTKLQTRLYSPASSRAKFMVGLVGLAVFATVMALMLWGWASGIEWFGRQ